MPIALGIDVSANRGLDLVLLDSDRAVLLARARVGVEELSDILTSQRPDVVAIDSPPSFGLQGSSRAAERDLRRRGILSFYTPTESGTVEGDWYQWMREGFRCFQAAASAGYELYGGGPLTEGHAIEVFPHACAVVLRGALPPSGTSRSARAKLLWRKTVLAEVSVDVSSIRSVDQADAALAALTGLMGLEGQFTPVGDAAEALIVLPGCNLPDRYGREPAIMSSCRPSGGGVG